MLKKIKKTKLTMLKNNKVAEIFGEVSSKMADQVIGLYREQKGREEPITDGIFTKLNLDLMSEIKQKLNGLNLDFVDFKVNLIRKKDENINGSDMVFDLKIISGEKEISKSFLSQAKIGSYNKKKGNFVTANRADTLKQADDMLLLTSDSFFFIYTDKGIKVISAFQVQFNNKNSINSDDVDYKNFNEFMILFFQCFIGDHKISNLKESNRPDLKQYIEDREADILEIEAKIKTKEDKSGKK